MIDRRTVIKAGAWAAPVVMTATAVPAAVASNPDCPATVYLYDPKLYPELNGGTQNNVAKVTVNVGKYVEVEYVRDYPNQTSVNIRGHALVRSPDSGVKAGHKVLINLSACEDPAWIQVDGNNVHYYGNGKFA